MRRTQGPTGVSPSPSIFEAPQSWRVEVLALSQPLGTWETATAPATSFPSDASSTGRGGRTWGWGGAACSGINVTPSLRGHRALLLSKNRSVS